MFPLLVGSSVSAVVHAMNRTVSFHIHMKIHIRTWTSALSACLLPSGSITTTLYFHPSIPSSLPPPFFPFCLAGFFLLWISFFSLFCMVVSNGVSALFNTKQHRVESKSCQFSGWLKGYVNKLNWTQTFSQKSSCPSHCSMFYLSDGLPLVKKPFQSLFLTSSFEVASRAHRLFKRHN